MIYLKTYKLFELNKSTYLSAARKLSDISHNDRSIELLKHSNGIISINTLLDTINVNNFSTILDSIDVDIPQDFRISHTRNYNIPIYSTVLRFENSIKELMEIDEYDIVQKYLDKKIDGESFVIKYIFKFKVLSDNIMVGKDNILNIVFTLSLDKNTFLFSSTTTYNHDRGFSFNDRNSAKEFKNLFKMIVLKSETYIQRIIDNEYFSIKWDDIINVVNNISLNRLYNQAGKINFKFGPNNDSV